VERTAKGEERARNSAQIISRHFLLSLFNTVSDGNACNFMVLPS